MGASWKIWDSPGETIAIKIAEVRKQRHNEHASGDVVHSGEVREISKRVRKQSHTKRSVTEETAS